MTSKLRVNEIENLAGDSVVTVRQMASSRVNTLANLIALDPADMTSVQVLGYYTTGDGGGGPIRVWKTGAPGAYVDNGGSIIVPSGGDGSGAWVWEWSGAVNVKWFGAKGDGVADDTATIQSSINYATTIGADVFIPSGEYKIKNDNGATAQGIVLKSNVIVYGEGGGSVLSAFTDNTDGYIIGAPREQASAVVTNFGMRDLKVVAPLALAGTRDGAAILIDWAENVLIQNVTVEDGSDACIRVTGYGDGAFTNDTLSAFWNSSKNITIENCNMSNGYFGVEVEGGAENVLIKGCRIKDIIAHGIRVPSGYNVRCVSNTLTDMVGRGFWIDRHRDVLIDGNYVECTGDANSHCVALGGFSSADANDNGMTSTNVIITNNTLLSTNGTSFIDSYQGSSEKFTDGVIFSDNTVKGDVFFLHSQKFNFSNNFSLSASVDPWQGDSTGSVTDNNMILRFNGDGYLKRAGNGGNIIAFNNMSPTTFKPDKPLVQGGYVGVSNGAPTTGTWQIGHWVQNGSIESDGNNFASPFGFMCVIGGTPGTWVPVGQPVNQYSRDFHFSRSGNSQNRTLLTFSIPNDSRALQLIVEGLMSRAPAGSVGTSRTFKKTFFFVRNAGINTVIDSALSVNDYDTVTTTAGGPNNAASPAIAASITSGGISDRQTIAVTATYTGIAYLTARIAASSTDTLDNFEL